MLAFHNNPEIKAFYLKRVNQHFIQDEIIKGIYWQNGKGCAVGCTIHGNDHSAYEKEIGIPRLLARLEDSIFENLPNERAKLWPVEFLLAVNVGADLSNVWPQFAIWMLIDKEWGVIQFAKTDAQRKVIRDIALAYGKNDVSAKDWQLLKKIASAATAASASAAAAYAAAAAADAATATAAAYASTAAAYASAAAAYASAAAAAAAAAAADAAYAAYAADAADDAYAAYAADAYLNAKYKCRTAQANKLLKLLKNCK